LIVYVKLDILPSGIPRSWSFLLSVSFGTGRRMEAGRNLSQGRQDRQGKIVIARLLGVLCGVAREKRRLLLTPISVVSVPSVAETVTRDPWPVLSLHASRGSLHAVVPVAGEDNASRRHYERRPRGLRIRPTSAPRRLRARYILLGHLRFAFAFFAVWREAEVRSECARVFLFSARRPASCA
jgi:hypothetical protein